MAKVNKKQWKMMLKGYSMKGKYVLMLSRDSKTLPFGKMLAAKWLKVV